MAAVDSDLEADLGEGSLPDSLSYTDTATVHCDQTDHIHDDDYDYDEEDCDYHVGELGCALDTLNVSEEYGNPKLRRLDLRLPNKMMEETAVPTNESYGYDSFDEQTTERPAERWAPLGAAVTTPPVQGEQDHTSQMQKLQTLEDEQDQLNSSLLALTTHFAQVQFRLKQIVSAPADEKETLLKDLEEFAFKGIPDVRGCQVQDAQMIEEMSQREHDMKLNEQRRKQQELIIQLKSQLEDLETYAYETGDAQLPTNQVMHKQRVVIDQLRNRLDLDLTHFEKLSPEDLRQAVDYAVSQIVNPVKVKEKLVDQLKTQITDLERFIEFLQGDAETPGPLGKDDKFFPNKGGAAVSSEHEHEEKPGLRETTISVMKQALTVLQIFAISQFGCGGQDFQKNLLKRTSKGNHWGDLRARLEISIERVIKLVEESEQRQIEESDYTSDSEDAPSVLCNQELTTAVRKDLAIAIRDLLQHGLMEVGQSNSLVPFGCFPVRARKAPKMMHAWDLFLKYYDMKHGKAYNESPARKLSQSFCLEMVGGKAITSKQTMLTAVEEVLSSHVPLKRSEDSQFKAFVCTGLNQKRLVTWLRLVLRQSGMVEYYYQPWSYVVKTGFDDALVSLDRLSKLNLHLPVDLAVRPFKNIRDAF